MHYNALLVHVFEPFTAIDVTELEEAATTTQSIENTPHKIASDARDSLEILLRSYYLRHGFEELDSFSIQFLAMLGARSLAQLKEDLPPPHRESVNSTLMLAAKGMEDQGQSSWLARTTFRLFCKEMSLDTRSLFERFARIELEDVSQPLDARNIQSQWPIKIEVDNVDDDLEKQRLGNLIKLHIESSSGSDSTGEGLSEHGRSSTEAD